MVNSEDAIVLTIVKGLAECGNSREYFEAPLSHDHYCRLAEQRGFVSYRGYKFGAELTELGERVYAALGLGELPWDGSWLGWDWSKVELTGGGRDG